MGRTLAALCLLCTGACAQLAHDSLPILGAGVGAALGSLGGPAIAAAGGAAGALGGSYAAGAVTGTEEVALPKSIESRPDGGAEIVLDAATRRFGMSDVLAWVTVAIFALGLAGAWWKIYKDSEEIDENWEAIKALTERVVKLEAKP